MRVKRVSLRRKGAGSGSWTRSQRRWAVPFVLAMLVLRALVPAGFMLAPVDGQLAVVLCDADSSAYLHPHAGHEHAGHDMAGGDMAGHDMPGHDHSGGHQHTHPDSTCPYAQSGGASPPPFVAALAAPMVPSASVLRGFSAQTTAHFGPARQQSPRGPPHLA
jgi:hypothetical protein